MSGSYNAGRPGRSRGDLGLTVVAQWDGGATRQGGQAVDSSCFVGDRPRWGEPVPASACEGRTDDGFRYHQEMLRLARLHHTPYEMGWPCWDWHSRAYNWAVPG
jgi:hypothetical protein